MSLVKTQLAVAAAALAGVNMQGAAVESVLNDLVGIEQMKIVEVNERGQAVVFFAVAGVMKVVADYMGVVRIFSNASSALTAVKRSKIGSGVTVTVRKFDATQQVGSPVQTLIAKHKQAVKESVVATRNITKAASSLVAAEAQGWQDESGTPQRATYDNMLAAKTTIEEWKTIIDAKIAALAQALTAANISPTTYLSTVA